MADQVYRGSLQIDFSQFEHGVVLCRAQITIASSGQARDRMKAIHLLLKHGGRWVPKGKPAVDAARRTFLKLRPDYAVEFVWLLSKYRACAKEPVQELLRTASIKKHLARHSTRVEELLAAWG